MLKVYKFLICRVSLLPIQSRNQVIDLPALAVLLSVVRGASEVTVSGTTETMIK